MKARRLHLVSFVTLIIMSLLSISCDNHNEVQKIELEDNNSILKSETRHHIENTEIQYPTKIQVLDSIPYNRLDQICDSLWEENKDKCSVLIVASEHPNYVFVRLGEQFDGAMTSANEGALGSNEYYLNQLADTLDINNKLINTVNQLYISLQILGNSIIYEQIKGEILGELYMIVKPDDSWLYKFIYVWQRPFVWMVNLTGNFYVGVFLVWLFLAVLAFISTSWVVRHFKNIQKRRAPTYMDEKLFEIYFNIPLMIMVLFLSLGGLTLGMQFSNSGAEFSKNLIEYAGVRYSVVDDIFSGTGSQSNWLMACLAMLTLYIKEYQQVYVSTVFKTGLFATIVIMSPLCLQWTFFILFLYGAIFNFKTFYNCTYIDLRIHGNGAVISTFMTLLHPLAIIVGIFGGNSLANYGVDEIVSKQAIQNVANNAYNNDKPRPHIIKWCSQFDESIVEMSLETTDSIAYSPKDDLIEEISQKSCLFNDKEYNEIKVRLNIKKLHTDEVLCLILKDTVKNVEYQELVHCNQYSGYHSLLFDKHWILQDYDFCYEEISISDSLTFDGEKITNNTNKIIGIVANNGRFEYVLWPNSSFVVGNEFTNPHYYMLPTRFQPAEKEDDNNGSGYWYIVYISLLLYFIFLIYYFCAYYFKDKQYKRQGLFTFMKDNEYELLWIPSACLMMVFIVVYFLYLQQN